MGAEGPSEPEEHPGREEDREGEAEAHAAGHAITPDQVAAERRRQDDRQPLDHRLHREAGEPATARQLLPEQGEGRRQPQRLPGHHQRQTEEDHGDRGRGEVEGKAGHGERAEDEERAPAAQAVGEDSARVGVDCTD